MPQSDNQLLNKPRWTRMKAIWSTHSTPHAEHAHILKYINMYIAIAPALKTLDCAIQ